MLQFKKILCPTDFSEPSYEAVRAASQLASHFGSELWFIHAVMPAPAIASGMDIYNREMEDSAKKSLEEVVAQLESEDLKTHLTVLKGNPAEEILKMAEEEHIDLIVIATRGRTGLDRLVFGSVAEKVVRFSHCPVLTVGSFPALSPEESNEKSLTEEQGEMTDTTEQTQERAANYLENIGNQLNELKTEIDWLIKKIVSSKKGLKKEYEAKKEKFDAKTKINDVKKTSKATLEEIVSGMRVSLQQLKEDYDRFTTKTKEVKEKMAEKTKKKKTVYTEKAEAELREWNATIELLKAKANKSRADIKIKYIEEVDNLENKLKVARQKVREFRESGDEAWAELKEGADQALADMKSSLKNAVSRFKER